MGLTALLGRFVLLGALARQPASGASSPGASLPAARPGAPAGVPEWGSQRADEAKPVRVAIGKPDNGRAGPMVNGNPWPPRVFRVVADFDGSTKRYVGHGRPSKISLATRGRAPSKPGSREQAPECRIVLFTHAPKRTPPKRGSKDYEVYGSRGEPRFIVHATC